jgi:hypothetical protein
MQLRWRQKNYMLHAIVCHHVKMSIQLDSGITTSIIIELLKKVKKKVIPPTATGRTWHMARAKHTSVFHVCV